MLLHFSGFFVFWRETFKYRTSLMYEKSKMLFPSDNIWIRKYYEWCISSPLIWALHRLKQWLSQKVANNCGKMPKSSQNGKNMPESFSTRCEHTFESIMNGADQVLWFECHTTWNNDLIMWRHADRDLFLPHQ